MNVPLATLLERGRQIPACVIGIEHVIRHVPVVLARGWISIPVWVIIATPIRFGSCARIVVPLTTHRTSHSIPFLCLRGNTGHCQACTRALGLFCSSGRFCSYDADASECELQYYERNEYTRDEQQLDHYTSDNFFAYHR